ncbi:MAG: nucleotide exchange factor GrpE [Arenicellales bacterium]|jgi:molecular chaperone GrpE|nr:nucleotide exchange factor GrpE [Arenicellales bacterium]|tara:strand:- start:350 stop:961 length:612 start_codon:yes stop_codon:yes gene_type:complete
MTSTESKPNPDQDTPNSKAPPEEREDDKEVATPQEGDPVEADNEAENSNEIKTLQAELDKANDSYLRAVAEMENIRRRAENDVINARKFAIEGFASEMLQVKESLDLAQSAELGSDESVADKMQEGLALTLKQMTSVFEKFGLEEVMPEVNERFDHALHQAITMLESSDVEPNHIVNVVQKGYRLKERLLRPAMVVVAKAPAE